LVVEDGGGEMLFLEQDLTFLIQTEMISVKGLIFTHSVQFDIVVLRLEKTKAM